MNFLSSHADNPTATATVIFVIFAWLAHWIGDFVCQTDNMAINKSKSNEWLTKHVFVYTLVLYFILLLPFSFYFTLTQFSIYILFNGVAHWITDYFTSRRNAKMWGEKRVHDFFVGVGLDQLIHLVTLVVSGYYVFFY